MKHQLSKDLIESVVDINQNKLKKNSSTSSYISSDTSPNASLLSCLLLLVWTFAIDFLRSADCLLLYCGWAFRVYSMKSKKSGVRWTIESWLTPAPM